MASTNILVFDESKSNIMSDADYGSDPQRANGVQTGIASSQLHNKSMLQSSYVAKAIANLMVANGYNANDSDNISTFSNNLSSSVVQKVADKASTSEAQGGTNDTHWMSPATTKSEIDQRFISPAFSGTPTAPTASYGVNNTQLATTAFVNNAFTNYGLVGDIKLSAADQGPKWHKCDGSIMNQASYPALYDTMIYGPARNYSSTHAVLTPRGTSHTTPYMQFYVGLDDSDNIFYAAYYDSDIYFFYRNVSATSSFTSKMVFDNTSGYSTSIYYCGFNNGYYVICSQIDAPTIFYTNSISGNWTSYKISNLSFSQKVKGVGYVNGTYYAVIYDQITSKTQLYSTTNITNSSWTLVRDLANDQAQCKFLKVGNNKLYLVLRGASSSSEFFAKIYSIPSFAEVSYPSEYAIWNNNIIDDIKSSGDNLIINRIFGDKQKVYLYNADGTSYTEHKLKLNQEINSASIPDNFQSSYYEQIVKVDNTYYLIFDETSPSSTSSIKYFARSKDLIYWSYGEMPSLSVASLKDVSMTGMRNYIATYNHKILLPLYNCSFSGSTTYYNSTDLYVISPNKVFPEVDSYPLAGADYYIKTAL